MSKGIQDLGTGLGFVYVTEPDGTTIVSTIPNTCDEVRDTVKSLTVSASAIHSNRSGIGGIEVDAVSGTGNITAVTVAGINQIASSINVTGLSESQVAIAIRNAVNSFNPTGTEYTAIAIGTTVKLIADESAGSSVNGDAVAVTSDDPVNLIFTTTDITGGSNNNEVYDESCGYRFFIDADYSAAGGSCAGEGEAVEGDLTKAVEITNSIVMQGLQGSLKTSDLSVVGGSISPDRKSAIGFIQLDTESAAATDDLDTIDPEDFSDGDIVIFFGADSGRVTTFKHGVDNIYLNGSADFETGDTQDVIALQRRDQNFYEVWRTKNTFTILAGSITEVELADDSVSTVKIQDEAVTEQKLADDSVTTDKIQDGSVTVSKLADGAITVDKLDSQTNTALIIANGSFETGEQGDYKIKFPFDCTVQEVSVAVVKLIEATEDATVIAKNHAGDVMGGGVITLPGGLTNGSAVDSLPTSNNTFTAGESMKLTLGKTTPGGKVIMSIKLLKTGTGTGGTIVYQAPTFTSFVLVGFDTLEVGDSIPAGAQTFNWSTLNSGNVQANSIDLIDVTGGSVVLGSGLANDGTETVSLSGAITKTAIATHQFKIQGQNSQGGNFDRTKNINWQFRKFFGNDSNIGPLSEVQVEALANNPLDSGFAGTYFFPGGDYKYLAFPTVWGTPSSFTDQDTMLAVPMEASYVVNLTNGFGVAQDYNVYRTTNILGGDVTIIVA